MQLNLSEYCNREITCSCGSVHFCPINDVKVGSGVLKELPTLLNEYKHILIVADANTYGVCGREVENLLRGKVCFTHIYHRGGVLIPNEEAVNELLECMPCETDFVLGIGSGVINDICKFVTWKKGLKCGIVATAPSMDGYASSGAAMITNGMKVTYTTHPPIYIIADIDYIKQAPMHMIRSGYGDIIGKYSSLNDWKLSHFVLGEPFCDEIYRLIYDVTESVRHSVNQIKNRENEAIENLMNALILIGITLSFLGTTRPGSGGEHHLSHFFEVVGLVRNEPHYPHGTDVAYATIFTAFMRECICAVDKPVFTNETIEERHKNWKRIYGPLYDEVKELQEKSKSYENDLTGFYTSHWEEITEILSECPSATECRKMLEDIGFGMEEYKNMYGTQKIYDAMMYGKDLKDRYSVLWIYYFMFVK